MWQVVADLGEIMISAKKSNGVKNITNNMYKKTNHFYRNWQKHEFKREKNGGIIFLQYTQVNQKTK